MNQPAQHVACDGCGIANDDVKELEMIRRRDEIRQELFRNAARVRKAMRSNAWLRPVFRKYKKVCREILQQKKQEATHFATLCDYCDNINNNAGPDMKLIREELEQIHAQMTGLEEMRNDSSASSSEMSDDSDTNENEDNEDNENNGRGLDPSTLSSIVYGNWNDCGC